MNVGPSERDTDPTTALLVQRRDTLRARLVAAGAFTVADIAALRGTSEADAAEFVARACAERRLFTVTGPDGVVLVPACLLDAAGGLAAPVAAVEVLAPLGLDGWELWAWLGSPSPWLSGEVPAEVFTTDPDRALAAVEAYAAELTDHCKVR